MEAWTFLPKVPLFLQGYLCLLLECNSDWEEYKSQL